MTEREVREEPPPLFSWRTWYVMVIGMLMVLILLFYFFTIQFQ